MAKIVIADLHIKLGQKNVPKAWQTNRFMMLAEKLNTAKELLGATALIIAGDLLDVADPSLEEVGLMYDFLSALAFKELILIPGNHEMVSKQEDSYLYIEKLLSSLKVKVIRKFETYKGVDFIPYNIIKDEWPAPQSKVCITHVRGEIPPHVKPEIDLDKFNAYTWVISGDLHSYTNSQRNLLYPGSPMTTSFHRNRASGSNGFIFLSDQLVPSWHELDLPQLIRKTVTDPALIVADKYDHVIYEVEGSMEELKNLQGSELLDKKVVTGVSAPATLNMTGDLLEEVEEYLTSILRIEDVSPYLTLLEDVKGE
jgi:DNA repair exonuclease SbcCD nuclease subunit